MSVVGWPDGPKLPHTAPCIICGKLMPLSELTAGSCYADGQQAFGCTAHQIRRRTWIVAWAEFNATERPIDQQRRPLDPIGDALRPDLVTV